MVEQSFYKANSAYYDRNAERYEAASWYHLNRFKDQMVEQDFRAMAACWPEGPLDVLEIGPGTGYLLEKILRYAKGPVAYTGVEHSEKIGAILRARHSANCASFTLLHESVTADILPAQLNGRYYDLIAGSSILHHLPDYPDIVEILARALKPGGILYFNREPLHEDECAASSPFSTVWDKICAGLSDRMIRSPLPRLLYPQKVKAESANNIAPLMFAEGISQTPFDNLVQSGEYELLLLRKYNRRFTAFLSRVENSWAARWRKDVFGNTMFAIALRRRPES